jgi:hypothetical protein
MMFQREVGRSKLRLGLQRKGGDESPHSILFGAEGDDWVDCGGAMRGDETGEQRGGG